MVNPQTRRIALIRSLTISWCILLFSFGANAAAAQSPLSTDNRRAFQDLSGITFDAHGNAYVSEGNANRIVKVSERGQVVAEWGNPPGYVNWSPDKPPPLGIFSRVGGIALNKRGDIYAVDVKDFRVEELSPRGRPLRMWGLRGTGPGQFLFPGACALDRFGNLYVMDSASKRVQKCSATGRLLRVWGGRDTPSGRFQDPEGIAVDDAGKVYVTDGAADQVVELSPGGRRVRVWGGIGRSHGKFEEPSAIALDRRDSVYVADRLNHRIQKFTSTGVFQLTWGRYGTAPGRFIYPSALAVDPHGNIFVADPQGRIQRFTAYGKLLGTWR